MDDDAIQSEVYRAIAYEKAAVGFGESPWLSPLFHQASAQIRSTALEQGQVSAEEWDTRKGTALRLSQVQRDTLASSDTEQTEAELDEGAIGSAMPLANATLSGIYGARVGWEARIGEMPDLDARHPGKMMAFLDVQRKIDDGDKLLSERAERLYQGMAEYGMETDDDFARVVQAQYEQFHAIVAADLAEAPLTPLTALDSALGHPHAEVIESHSDPLVARTADAAMKWLYHIGSNRYENESNTFAWDPKTEHLTIEGEVSLTVQRHGEQWQDLGSDVDEPFVQRLESHLQAQSKSKPSQAGQSR
ncbi:MAG: hypothetical protein AAGD25_15275 [Cyanobacteria bacterium P01_F01_bin.150]